VARGNPCEAATVWPVTCSMAVLTLFPMSSGPSTPLRHPSHRSRQKTPSQESFVDKWRDRMRSEVAAKVKAVRQQSKTNARGGEDEVPSTVLMSSRQMMGVIFRGEEKRRLARMEREASLVHQKAIEHLDEAEDIGREIEFDPDEALLEEVLRVEEEELAALLAAMEEEHQPKQQSSHEITGEMEDIEMSDIDLSASQ
jgi:hypothetical protein